MIIENIFDVLFVCSFIFLIGISFYNEIFFYKLRKKGFKDTKRGRYTWTKKEKVKIE